MDGTRIVSAVDVTDRKRPEASVGARAFREALTGLADRRMPEEHLAHAMAP